MPHQVQMGQWMYDQIQINGERRYYGNYVASLFVNKRLWRLEHSLNLILWDINILGLLELKVWKGARRLILNLRKKMKKNKAMKLPTIRIYSTIVNMTHRQLTNEHFKEYFKYLKRSRTSTVYKMGTKKSWTKPDLALQHGLFQHGLSNIEWTFHWNRSIDNRCLDKVNWKNCKIWSKTCDVMANR